ncbi:hypothetical protein D9M68_786360 [compost metagenome]
MRQLGEHIVPTRDAQQLGHPADAADVRLVPLFKKHPWAALARSHQRGHVSPDRVEPGARGGDPGQPLFSTAHHGRHLVQHGKDLVHAALVEHRHLHPGADQQGRDVGLQIGKAEHAVRLQRQDLVDLRAEKSADLGLLFPRPARAHRIARDADDAALLPEQVEPLGGFFGQADDALRTQGGGVHGDIRTTPARRR